MHDLIHTDTSHHWDCEPEVSLHLRASNHSVAPNPTGVTLLWDSAKRKVVKSPDYNDPYRQVSRCFLFHYQWLLFLDPEGWESGCGAGTT